MLCVGCVVCLRWLFWLCVGGVLVVLFGFCISLMLYRCVMPCFFRYSRLSSSCFLSLSFGVMVGVLWFVDKTFTDHKHMFWVIKKKGWWIE